MLRTFYQIKDLFFDSPEREERRLDALEFRAILPNNFISDYQRKVKRNEFAMEFKAVCRKQNAMPIASIATEAVHSKKNISTRVLPFDHNIVRITARKEDETSNYINASWIEGYEIPKRYIAAQGPNIRSIGDFWRMIVQHKVHCIVMCTNLFEHARLQCEKYWNTKKVTFDDVDVELDSEQFTAEFVLRTFRIKCNALNVPTRDVFQIQFQSWSESSTPFPSTLLEVRRQMQIRATNPNHPVLVHCSTGAGRTGVFIAVDILLDKYGKREPLDVAEQVITLRNARSHMIPQSEQYRYIYEVVCNYITCGNTVLPGSDLLQHCIKQGKDNGKGTGFEEELLHVNSLVPLLSVGECAGGHRTENRWKSRNIMIQPPERARPYLLSHDSADSSDFVNAVFVDGYRMVNQYIVSQWPLKNTINDLWRLMSDHHVSVVVVLNNFECKNKGFPRFWPVIKNQCTGFGPIGVELEDEFSCSPNVFCRIFSMQRVPRVFHHKKNVQRSRVVLLQLTCWPNQCKIPDSTAGLIEIIYLAKLWHNKLGMNHPVLVICRDGVCRAGAYCAVSLCLDRLKATGEVDIFRAVETVKKNRPQLVENVAEYTFIYYCLRDILQLYSSKSYDQPPNHEVDLRIVQQALEAVIQRNIHASQPTANLTTKRPVPFKFTICTTHCLQCKLFLLTNRRG